MQPAEPPPKVTGSRVADLNSVTLAAATRKSHTQALEKAKEASAKSTSLPMGFYDDPLADAKAHNIDAKTVIKAANEEDWEEFMNFAKEVEAEERHAVVEEEERYTQQRELAAAAEDAVYHTRLHMIHQLRDMKKENPNTKFIPKADEEDELDDGVEGAELVRGISFLTAANREVRGVSAREVSDIVQQHVAAAKRQRAGAQHSSGGGSNTSKRMRIEQEAIADGDDDGDVIDSDADLDDLLDWRKRGVS